MKMKVVEKTDRRRRGSDSSPFEVLGRCSVAVPLVISLVVAAPAQDAGSGAVLEAGADRLVSTSIDDRPIVEPHLAVDPVDPERLLAVAMVAALPPPGQGLAARSGRGQEFGKVVTRVVAEVGGDQEINRPLRWRRPAARGGSPGSSRPAAWR